MVLLAAAAAPVAAADGAPPVDDAPMIANVNRVANNAAMGYLLPFLLIRFIHP